MLDVILDKRCGYLELLFKVVVNGFVGNAAAGVGETCWYVTLQCPLLQAVQFFEERLLLLSKISVRVQSLAYFEGKDRESGQKAMEW